MLEEQQYNNNNKWAGRLRRKNIDIKKAEGNKKFAKKSWKQEKKDLYRTPPARSLAKTPSPPRKRARSPIKIKFAKKLDFNDVN